MVFWHSLLPHKMSRCGAMWGHGCGEKPHAPLALVLPSPLMLTPGGGLGPSVLALAPASPRHGQSAAALEWHCKRCWHVLLYFADKTNGSWGSSLETWCPGRQGSKRAPGVQDPGAWSEHVLRPRSRLPALGCVSGRRGHRSCGNSHTFTLKSCFALNKNKGFDKREKTNKQTPRDQYWYSP